MDTTLDAWIITVGNEILNGVITDTNRETISRELRSIGIAAKGMTSVGDDIVQISDALESAMQRARITVVSGGLGPTEDDKTTAAAAQFLGVPLESDSSQLARIEERFRRWSRPMPPSNAKQALFPAGAIPIDNDYGTAPGFMIERAGRLALFFPGVPNELVRMLREKAMPAIVERYGSSRQVFRTKTLYVYGLAEAKLGEILSDIAPDEDDFHLAFLPRFPVIRLRMDARGASAQEADAKLTDKQRIMEERIRENIISDNGRQMEQVVLALLEQRGWSLALAESITGGMIGDMITRVPGSSRTFMGSVVSYSNEMKMAILHVSPKTLERYGAVSHQCAREMALGARDAGGADVALSVTGIAGPDGGTAEKPVGTFFVGMAADKTVLTRRFLLAGERWWVRTLAAMQSLDLLRRYLLGFRIQGEPEQEG